MYTNSILRLVLITLFALIASVCPALHMSVQDFGATGDGVTNDRAAFQAALQAAQASATKPVTVIVPMQALPAAYITALEGALPTTPSAVQPKPAPATVPMQALPTAPSVQPVTALVQALAAAPPTVQPVVALPADTTTPALLSSPPAAAPSAPPAPPASTSALSYQPPLKKFRGHR